MESSVATRDPDEEKLPEKVPQKVTNNSKVNKKVPEKLKKIVKLTPDRVKCCQKVKS
jgi:hypothetical protein